MRHWIIACTALALLWPTSVEAVEPTAEVMAQQVANTLRESGELTNYRVGVKYEDGVAWLLGSVTSEEQAATAKRLTSKIEGVEAVISKLQIVAPPVAKKVAIKKAPKPASDAGLALATLETSGTAKLAPKPLPAPAALAPIQTQAPRVASRPLPMAQGQRGLPRPMQRMMPRGPQQGGPQQGHPQQGPQGYAQQAQHGQPMQRASYAGGMPSPQGRSSGGAAGVSYDQANMPDYAWPSYAAHPNYAALTYPKQYSPSAWPYIGPFYPYPQVPLGWRKVTLEWDDGWWNLDFSHNKGH